MCRAPFVYANYAKNCKFCFTDFAKPTKMRMRYGSRSISTRYRSGSGSGYGSFYHQAKIVRKTLIAAVL